jgi:hypothetical protein
MGEIARNFYRVTAETEAAELGGNEIGRIDQKLVRALSQPMRDLRWQEAPEPLRAGIAEATLEGILVAGLAAFEEGRRRASGNGSEN